MQFPGSSIVVGFDDKSPETDPMDFLKRTKLADKKSYTEKDLILISMNKKMHVDLKKFVHDLKELKPKPTFYMIGKPTDKPFGNFVIFSPYPKVTKDHIYNIEDVGKRMTYPFRSIMNRSMREEDVADNVAVYDDPFGLLGIADKRDEIMKKFNLIRKPDRGYAKIPIGS